MPSEVKKMNYKRYYKRGKREKHIGVKEFH